MKPAKQAIDASIRRLLTSRPTPLEGALGRIETAIFLEETFGFVLSDSEISELALDDPAAIGLLVMKKMDQL